MARDASTIRYRELYGFINMAIRNRCIARSWVAASRSSRGAASRKARLPLRTYYALMIYKNGVPIGYFEGLSL